MARPRDQCWPSGDNADQVNETHGRANPSNAVQSHEELHTSAQRSYIGCATGRAASVVCKHITSLLHLYIKLTCL